MTDYSDAVVGEYLRRLDVAASPLPADRRAELLEEISQHIAHARASGEAADEAGLRELLDRLGEPEDIVAEASADGLGGLAPSAQPGGHGSPYAPGVQRLRKPGIGLEIAAVTLMTIGSLIPLVGWLTGTALLWASRRFTVAEKILATAVVPGGPFTVLFLGVMVGGQSCSSSSTDSAGNAVQGPTSCTGFALPTWLGLPLLLVAVVGPFVIGGGLLMRASDRAAAEPPIPVVGPPGPGVASRWGGLEIAAVLLLSVGALLLPVVGPVAGLICAWLSTQWTPMEKWVATAIASLALVLPLLALVSLHF